MGCGTIGARISGRPVKYESDDLLTLFNEKQDDFLEMAQIFLDNEYLGENGKTGRNSFSVRCDFDDQKEYFFNYDGEKWERLSFYYCPQYNSDLSYHKGKYDSWIVLEDNWYFGDDTGSGISSP